jgi:transposase
MSESKRKSFTCDFKAQIALEAIRGLKTINEIGQDFGIHPTQVALWKKELTDHASNVFDIKRGTKPIDPSTSPERLYSEIGRLKMELDWLKKKSGISL